MLQDISPLDMKRFIVRTLDLEDTRPEDIGDDQPLFAGGLGLDSIDALELGLALQKRYGLSMSTDSEQTRKHFGSVQALAAFVAASRTH